MHSTLSAAKRSCIFATRRSRSWRRTNRLFNAISPNRTRRTTRLSPTMPDSFSLVINTAPTLRARGRAPPLDSGCPHLRRGVHLFESGPRRWTPVRADPPVDRRARQGSGGTDLSHADDCDRDLVRDQPPPPRARGLPAGGRPPRGGTAGSRRGDRFHVEGVEPRNVRGGLS